MEMAAAAAPGIEELFGECGTVKDVEIIKQKIGQSRGFAFVAMASGEEARAVVDRFDSYVPLLWKKGTKFMCQILLGKLGLATAELFSEKFKPLSARVVFENPTGRSSGYGFVAFATKEEAEASISELDGKELMGRPVRLRVSEKVDDHPESASEEGNDSEGQADES